MTSKIKYNSVNEKSSSRFHQTELCEIFLHLLFINWKILGPKGETGADGALGPAGPIGPQGAPGERYYN